VPTVVADAGPLHYLILIGAAGLLPGLFGRVLVPRAVCNELTQPTTPLSVREYMALPPPRLVTLPSPPPNADPDLAALGEGERTAIMFAIFLRADMLLMDNRAGVAGARARGCAVTGTLGLLDRAARRGLINLGAAFKALRKTNFHAPEALMASLLAAQTKKASR
jgi:predicted nucleic acid-binding protein